jgi:flagellar assembly protein FliH
MTSSSERKPAGTAEGHAAAGQGLGREPARASGGRDPAARTRRFDEPKGASFAERAAADAALHARSPFGAGSAASFSSGGGAGLGSRSGLGADAGAGGGTGAGSGGMGTASSSGAGGHYARFIPREEVKSFSAWTPGSFGAAPPRGEPGAGESAPAAPPTPAELAGQLQAARQSGYQDGYRDGLVALEAFKQSYAQQITAQMGVLAGAYRTQLEQLEHGLAVQVAEVAVALARQVVRSELTTRPEFVATVVQEALAVALAAAQQVTVHLHPDDHALVQAHAGEALAARGARLVPDAALARGGCVVETEMGVIDASLEARWRRASAAMGRPSEFEVQVPSEGSGS